MGKNYDELKDLTPEQLMAQIKLCFKFMAQCRAILEGEDIKDEAAIKLVDPTGDCEDMELFYACKHAANDETLTKAMRTIAAQDKKITRLQKRLAKKHDSEVSGELIRKLPLAVIKFDIEKLKNGEFNPYKELKKFLGGDLRPSERLLDEIRKYARSQQRTKPQPKFKKGDKVFFMYDDLVKSGIVQKEPMWVTQYEFYGYFIETPEGVYRMEEKYVFSDLAQLFHYLKCNVNGSED